MINFDKKVDRLGTYCTQWDYVEDRFGKKDLLPFYNFRYGFRVSI